MLHPSMKDEMDALEAQRADLDARLASAPEPDPIALHPGLSDIYRRKVESLVDSLNQNDTRAEAADLLRGLIETIIIHPRDGGHELELYGELGAILSLCEAGGTNANARLGGGRSGQVTVVAGAGFEPAAFRL